MKELINNIILYLPSYILTFLRIVVAPKRTIAELNKGYKNDLQNALIFLGATIVLASILGLSFFPTRRGILEFLGIELTLVIFEGIIYSAVVWFSWRIIGGRAPIERFATIYCYVGSIIIVVSGLGTLTSFSALKLFYPGSYKALLDLTFSSKHSFSEIARQLNCLPGYSVYMGILLITLGVLMIWYIVSWGAYRELTDQTKIRSFFSFTISTLILIPLIAAGSFISRFLMIVEN